MAKKPKRLVDPFDIITEILGEPAEQMRSPANADYQCPFINGECTKRSAMLEGPYPICTLYQRSTQKPICICPKRLLQAQIQDDIVAHAWDGPPPTSLCLAHEIQMEKFGKVDLVLVDVDQQAQTVKRFLPVEIQAVDITGSVQSAYVAIGSGLGAIESPAYNFNWANVRKRFVSQLITKGFFCHHWHTRMVAVVQTALFEELNKHAAITQVHLSQSNIVFMLYDYVLDDVSGRLDLSLQRVVPTTHNALMSAVLYETPPSVDKFQRILMRRLKGG